MRSDFRKNRAPLSHFNEFMEWQNIGTVVDSLVTEMHDHFTNDMRKVISLVAQEFPKIYMTALEYLRTLQSFMGETLNIVPDARSMGMWKKPVS